MQVVFALAVVLLWLDEGPQLLPDLLALLLTPQLLLLAEDSLVVEGQGAPPDVHLQLLRMVIGLCVCVCRGGIGALGNA